jgi:peptidoglycan/LPS O-acetylase OafA/YrhL
VPKSRVSGNLGMYLYPTLPLPKRFHIPHRESNLTTLHSWIHCEDWHSCLCSSSTSVSEFPHCDRLRRVTDLGEYGVQLFFLVSAFTLLTSLSQRSKHESRPIQNFLVRRFFRIAPLFWAALAFYFLYKGRQLGGYWSPLGISDRDMLLTAVFMHGWAATTINSVVPGGWSIAVEMNSYLLVPLLFRWITTFRRAVWLLVFSLIFRIVADVVVRLVFFQNFPTSLDYLRDSYMYLWLPAALPIFSFGFILFFILAPRLNVGASVSTTIGNADWALLLLVGAPVAAGLPGMGFASSGVVFLGLALSLALNPISLTVNGQLLRRRSELQRLSDTSPSLMAVS